MGITQLGYMNNGNSNTDYNDECIKMAFLLQGWAVHGHLNVWIDGDMLITANIMTLINVFI